MTGDDLTGLGVVGLGSDLLDIPRLRAVLTRRPRLVVRCFSEAEQDDVATRRDPVPGLAARFAAKEAVMKALGVGIGAIDLREVEVTRAPGGAPGLRLHGRAAALAEAHGVRSWRLTLSHSAQHAMAVALALG